MGRVSACIAGRNFVEVIANNIKQTVHFMSVHRQARSSE